MPGFLVQNGFMWQHLVPQYWPQFWILSSCCVCGGRGAICPVRTALVITCLFGHFHNRFVWQHLVLRSTSLNFWISLFCSVKGGGGWYVSTLNSSSHYLSLFISISGLCDSILYLAMLVSILDIVILFCLILKKKHWKSKQQSIIPSKYPNSNRKFETNCYNICYIWLVDIGFRQNYLCILPNFGYLGAKCNIFPYIFNQKRNNFIKHSPMVFCDDLDLSTGVCDDLYLSNGILWWLWPLQWYLVLDLTFPMVFCDDLDLSNGILWWPWPFQWYLVMTLNFDLHPVAGTIIL